MTAQSGATRPPAPSLLFIAGQWCDAADGARIPIVNPATEEIVGYVPRATATDLDRALAAADAAWRHWRETDAWSRSAALRRVAQLLRERADYIADVLTEEQGKPLAESRTEVQAAADQFDWFADEARRIYGRVVEGHSPAHRLLVLRQAIGPVAAFTPSNFPALLPARKIAPALAAGCSIIVKPAEEAPRTCLCIAQACAEAGVPPGVVNVVTGDPGTISRHLVASEVIRKVTLTGSVPVGREILRLCADGIKPVAMELGGHSPLLVFADADIEAAAEIAARGKFRNMGQVCIAASRIFVQDTVADRFTERFVAVTRSLRVGDGRDPASDLGPLASARRLTATEALIEDARRHGARVVTGGGRPPERKRGFFFEPTVLTDVSPAMRVMVEEPFGPLAPITRFSSIEDGLARANATEYGLAGYVFTRDTSTAFRVAEGLDVGMVGVNNVVIAAAEIPFGGTKRSGFGREGGSEGIEGYSVTKYVNIKL
ncbi:NAD-dependent succinate-semialdehyde dehydrogenase [Candidatus Binatia bacterium]|nr:NAD-dependent succinate-semialdehyde dehydrogenase [Candidatus Binatia bacterium]